MKSYPYFEVNSFTNESFKGNPAGVVLSDHTLPDKVLQEIAAQNNLSETAFVEGEPPAYRLRWFTPQAEVDLCGHATLATAHVLNGRSWTDEAPLTFQTQSGELTVARVADGYQLVLPARAGDPFSDLHLLKASLRMDVTEAYLSRDLVAVLPSETAVREFVPDQAAIEKLPGLGLLITSAGREFDFVSRCFFPKIGIPEDPVTGAAHCTLTPLWTTKLGQRPLRAYQASPRGGELLCELQGNRVLLTGAAQTYLEGTIKVPVE